MIRSTVPAFRWRWVAVAMFAVFATALTACDGSTSASALGDSSATSSQAVPATSSEDSTAVADAVTLADLMNAPVPSLCHHEPGVMVNGSLPIEDPRYGVVQIAEHGSGTDRGPIVAFGDLTGDGVPDGALVTTCSAGGVAWPATVQLYTEGAERLGGVDLGELTHGGREMVKGISISDGVVHVDWMTAGPGDGACCPSVRMSGDIRWDSAQVAMENMRKTGENPNATSASATLFEMNGDYFFVSPSGKFHCGIVSAGRAGSGAAAGCHGTTTPVPPRPASCSPSISWGGGMRVDTDGAVSYLCTGGVIFGPGGGEDPPSLGYGQTLNANGFSCSSATTGVTCRQNSTGHGFTIADNMNSSF